MKAMVYHRYGGPEVVGLAEMPTPIAKDNEVLIRVVATTVTTGDWRARSLNLPGGFGFMGRPVFGMFGPRQPILGTELSGVVEAIGKAVTRFTVGDEVFAFTGSHFGAHAEYRTVPENGLIARKPINISYEAAAALSFGGTTALTFLRDKGRIRRGEKVLVVGASGGVGTAAVQIACHLGAEVTGVTSTANVDLVRSLGAHDVIDYRAQDFAASGRRWDIILDTTATVSLARCDGVLNAGGRLIVVQGSFAQALGLERPAKGTGKRVLAGATKIVPQDVQTLADLAQTGVLKPVIDRSYPLEDAAKAHAYVDSGRKRGNVVLSVS